MSSGWDDLLPETQAPAEAPAEQDISHLREMARDVATLVDAERALAAESKQAKDALMEAMCAAGVTSVELDDRPPIKLVSGKSKKPTKKALVESIGKERGQEVWAGFPEKEYSYLSVPQPDGPDA